MAFTRRLPCDTNLAGLELDQEVVAGAPKGSRAFYLWNHVWIYTRIFIECHVAQIQ